MYRLSDELFKDFVEYEGLNVFHKEVIEMVNEDDEDYWDDIYDKYTNYISEVRLEEMDEYVYVQNYVDRLNKGDIMALKERNKYLKENDDDICPFGLTMFPVVHDMYSLNKKSGKYEIDKYNDRDELNISTYITNRIETKDIQILMLKYCLNNMR